MPSAGTLEDSPSGRGFGRVRPRMPNLVRKPTYLQVIGKLCKIRPEPVKKVGKLLSLRGWKRFHAVGDRKSSFKPPSAKDR